MEFLSSFIFLADITYFIVFADISLVGYIIILNSTYFSFCLVSFTSPKLTPVSLTTPMCHNSQINFFRRYGWDFHFCVGYYFHPHPTPGSLKTFIFFNLLNGSPSLQPSRTIPIFLLVDKLSTPLWST